MFCIPVTQIRRFRTSARAWLIGLPISRVIICAILRYGRAEPYRYHAVFQHDNHICLAPVAKACCRQLKCVFDSSTPAHGSTESCSPVAGFIELHELPE